MLILNRARFAIVAVMLVICTQLLSFTSAVQPNWEKSRGFGGRSCFKPLKAWYVLRPFTNCPPACSEPGETASRLTTRQSFKFDPDDCGVLVPVRIGGKEYLFVLDTGCTGSVFDTSLRPYLGQRIDAVEMQDSAGIVVPLDLYSAPDAYVGSLPMGEHRVACHDFTAMREADGRDIRGFLGMDFLKDWIIVIDSDEGRVDFLSPGTAKQPAWGESIPFEYGDTGVPQIRATLGKDIETSFVVDTGCIGTGQVDGGYLMLLHELHEARMSGKEKWMTFSGPHSSDVGRLSHLSVGPFRHDNLRFSSGPKNIFGLGYLSRYRVTIDFPNQRLYLAKGKRFADYDRGHTTGLSSLFKARGIVIESVDEEGPAYAAGVRANDVLVELCGKPASVLNRSEIGRVLAKEGWPLTMAVERDGKRIEMGFTPYAYEEEPRPKGTHAKPNCTETDSQTCASALTRWPCRRFRTRQFAFARLRCVEGS